MCTSSFLLRCLGSRPLISGLALALPSPRRHVHTLHLMLTLFTVWRSRVAKNLFPSLTLLSFIAYSTSLFHQISDASFLLLPCLLTLLLFFQGANICLEPAKAFCILNTLTSLTKLLYFPPVENDGTVAAPSILAY
jgi:hypothetical protein